MLTCTSDNDTLGVKVQHYPPTAASIQSSRNSDYCQCPVSVFAASRAVLDLSPQDAVGRKSPPDFAADTAGPSKNNMVNNGYHNSQDARDRHTGYEEGFAENGVGGQVLCLLDADDYRYQRHRGLG